MQRRLLAALRDTAQAAQFFGVPEPTIRRWRSAGLPKTREKRAKEYLEHLETLRHPIAPSILVNVKDVAEYFGVHISTARKWRKHGIPASREPQLAAFRGVETAKQDFQSLLGLVRAQGEKLDVESFDKDRDGRYTIGYEKQAPIETWLTSQVLDSLVVTLSNWKLENPPNAPNGDERPGWDSSQHRWIAIAKVSEFGPPAEARVAGYQAIIITSLNHPKAAQVNFAGVHTSGTQLSQSDAIEALQKDLAGMVNTPGLVNWIHSIYLSSYRHKTQAEITSHETYKRKKRGYNER